MGWSIDIAVTTTHKYAIKESGDVVEIVDLPDGGVGVIIADGQGSGPAARSIARLVAGQAWSLAQQGVRVGAVAMSVSDTLFQARGGKVSVSLDIAAISRAGMIEIARLSTNTLIVSRNGTWHECPGEAEPTGRYERQVPITEKFSARDIGAFVIVTDGVSGAGGRFDASTSLASRVQLADASGSASELAEAIFADAMEREKCRPGDDLTVVACKLTPSSADQRIERRLIQRDVR